MSRIGFFPGEIKEAPTTRSLSFSAGNVALMAGAAVKKGRKRGAALFWIAVFSEAENAKGRQPKRREGRTNTLPILGRFSQKPNTRSKIKGYPGGGARVENRHRGSLERQSCRGPGRPKRNGTKKRKRSQTPSTKRNNKKIERG